MTLPTIKGDGSRSYEVRGLLGRGGMGAVYDCIARDGAGLVRRVAIKVVEDQGREAEEYARRLRDEARVLGMLSHPGIVGVQGVVEVGGRWGIVLDYVEGTDLATLLADGPIPCRPALEIGSCVALALHVAHTAVHAATGAPLELVHRDVKPANVMVSPGGDVRVLDFGVASARFSGRESRTKTGIGFGTLAYAAPERLLRGLDSPKGDVYSLGLVILEAMTGRAFGVPLLAREDHAEQVDVALDRLPDEHPEVTGELRALLGAMLAFDPERRPPADDAGRELRRLAESARTPWLRDWATATVRTAPRARDPGPSTLREPPPPRWAWALAVLGALFSGGVFLVAAVGVFAFFSTRRETPPPAPADDAAPRSPVEDTPPPVPVPDEPPVAAPTPPTRRPPEPNPPPAPTTGVLVVQGDHRSATLRDAAGLVVTPGELPAGPYVLTVTFSDDRAIESAVLIEVGTTTALTCKARFQRCTAVTTPL